MSTQSAQRVLVTGATGFLGSRITHQLLKQTQMKVIGTTSQLEWKGNKLRQALANDKSLDDCHLTNRLDLIQCDMASDPECYYKAITETKPDYVIHTAAPFMSDVGPKEEADE